MKSPFSIVVLVAVGVALLCGAAARLLRDTAPAAATPAHDARGAFATSSVPLLAPDDEQLSIPDDAATPVETAAHADARTKLPAIDPAVPPEALTRAAAAPDPVHRVEMITAALRQWAAIDVDAAGAWALRHSPIPRTIAMAAVVNGAVDRSPDIAERFVQEFSERDPERAAEYGGTLIFALSEAGEHQRAAAWALNSDDDTARDWMTAAYDRWAAVEPEMALLSAVAVTDSLRRRAAVEAAVGSWARARPQTLVECAVGFPPGPEKNLALVTALRAWAQTAPEATATWIQTHGEAIADVPRFEIILEE